MRGEASALQLVSSCKYAIDTAACCQQQKAPRDEPIKVLEGHCPVPDALRSNVALSTERRLRGARRRCALSSPQSLLTPSLFGGWVLIRLPSVNRNGSAPPSALIAFPGALSLVPSLFRYAAAVYGVTVRSEWWARTTDRWINSPLLCQLS